MSPSPARTKPVSRDYINEETGEVVRLSHEEPVKTKRPKDSRETEPFFMAYTSGAGKLRSSGLSLTDRHVLDSLVEIMGFDEPLQYSSKAIGRELRMDPANVSRSIRALRAAGVFIQVGHRRGLIHPSIYWRGTRAGRMQWLHRIDQGHLGREKN